MVETEFMPETKFIFVNQNTEQNLRSRNWIKNLL